VVILEAMIVHDTRSITIDCYVNSTQKIEKTKKKIFFDKFFSDFLQFKSEQTHKQCWMGSFTPPAL